MSCSSRKAPPVMPQQAEFHPTCAGTAAPIEFLQYFDFRCSIPNVAISNVRQLSMWGHHILSHTKSWKKYTHADLFKAHTGTLDTLSAACSSQSRALGYVYYEKWSLKWQIQAWPNKTAEFRQNKGIVFQNGTLLTQGYSPAWKTWLLAELL